METVTRKCSRDEYPWSYTTPYVHRPRSVSGTGSGVRREKKSVDESLIAKHDEWKQRRVLQKILGNFDNLTVEQTALWIERDPELKKASEKKPFKSHTVTIKWLKWNVQNVHDPNIRNNLRYYPANYIETVKKALASEDPGNASDLCYKWPEGKTSLPNFATISDADLAKWKASNSDLFATKSHGQNSITDRALLRIRFAKSFGKKSQCR